mgnify:CR=1 FL=1
MKEITLKEWSAYLPYGLKFKTKRGFDTLSTLSDELINCDFEEWYSLNKVKPILYDLSWLTREIEFGGEKFIPNHDPLFKYFIPYELKKKKNSIPYSLSFLFICVYVSMLLIFGFSILERYECDSSRILDRSKSPITFRFLQISFT